MNWSVGAQSPDSDLIDVALLAAGKALYLCNRFETKCHHALKLMYIAEGMMSDPVVSLEEFIGSLPPDKMLNATLKDIGNVEARTNLVGMSEDDQAVLTKAKEARNFIAHEGADIGWLYQIRPQAVVDYLTKLRTAVADLAVGDNLVSTWLFYADEPGEPVPYLAVNYAALIDLWVFGDVTGDEDRASWSLVFHRGLPGIPTIPDRDIHIIEMSEEFSQYLTRAGYRSRWQRLFHRLRVLLQR